jgi:hypothetical protein
VSMTTLDERVAGAVSRARLLERALHSPHGWSIERGGQTSPASRELLSDRVVFTARFSGLGDCGPDTWLLQHGECLSYTRVPPMRLPDDSETTLCWELLVGNDSVTA